MIITFDQEADAAYLYLKAPKTDEEAYLYVSNLKVAKTQEIFPRIIYDYDEDGQIVGIELLSISYGTPAEFMKLTSGLNFPLTPEEKQQFQEFFSL